MGARLPDLSGKTILITGGGRGIGKGISLAFADAGATVGIIEHPESPVAEQTAALLRDQGAGGLLLSYDLSDTDGLADLADKAWTRLDGIDILVNNAGISYLERFNEVSVDRWRHLMRVNLDAPFFLAQRISEHMIAGGRRGRIINFTSKNALVSEAGLVHYNASKAALDLVTQTLAVELAEHGITVNSIAPGIIDTQMAEDFALDRERFIPYYKQHIPLGRAGSVDEVAGAVLFLASDTASYMTGSRIVIDGGVLSSQVPRLQFMPPYRNSLRTQSRAAE